MWLAVNPDKLDLAEISCISRCLKGRKTRRDKLVCTIKIGMGRVIGDALETREYGEQGPRLVKKTSPDSEMTNLQHKRSPWGNKIVKATDVKPWLAGCVEPP